MRTWMGWLVVLALVLVTGCEGERGLQGPPGETGPTGPAGGLGDAGLPDGTLQVSCLTPCHTFTGMVEQYKTSQHFAVYVENLGGEEAETWTGPQACGNCHASDALELRVAGVVNPEGAVSEVEHGHTEYASDAGAAVEATYAGQTTVAAVYCTTCHAVSAENDPHKTGAPYYQAGTWGYYVDTGPDAPSWLEKTPPGTEGVVGQPAGSYTTGNVCVFCHKSRKDVTYYIPAGGVRFTSIHWGPHLGPQADVYTGKGGFEFAGKTYGSSIHAAFEDGCVRCHMPPDPQNDNYPNHSFYAQVSVCANCHPGATSFDLNGIQTQTRAALTELQAALNTAGYLTRSETEPYLALTEDELGTDFEHDETMPLGSSTTVPQATAGVVWNYFLVARGSGVGVHNPTYALQLLYDSIEQLTGAPPTSIPTRP